MVSTSPPLAAAMSSESSIKIPRARIWADQSGDRDARLGKHRDVSFNNRIQLVSQILPEYRLLTPQKAC